MKIASLAVFAAILPLLAQGEEPQAQALQPSPGASSPVAEQAEAAEQQVEVHHRPWWKKTRPPMPVADRNRPPARPVATPATKSPAKPAKATPEEAPPAPKARKAPKAQPAKAQPTQPAEGVEPAEPAPKRKGGVFGALGRAFGGDKHEPVTSRSAVRRALPAPKNVAGQNPRAKAPATVAKSSKAAAETSKASNQAVANEAPQQVAAPAKKKPAKVSPTPPAPSAPAKPEISDELALPGDSALPQAPASSAPVAKTQATQATQAPKPEPAAAVEFNRKNYLEIKQKAAADPKVAELGKKLEAASSGEAHKTAARRYTKALFKKMNELDASQPDWYRRMEAAMMRRIDSGKPIAAE